MLKIIHWFLYGIVLLAIFSVVLMLLEKGLVDTITKDIFHYSIAALAFYILVLWLIKRQWIYFPWQHDNN